MSAEILSRIEDVLDSIRPALHSDGGDVELVEFDEEGFVHLTMHGACGGCPIARPGDPRRCGSGTTSGPT